MDAAMIREKIKYRLTKQITTYPVHRLSASRIGHPCERYLYLLLTDWEQQKPHDIGLQSIFNLGNSMEDYTISELKSAGLEIITPTQRSWKISLRNGVISGREDVRIKDPDSGALIPAEIKGLSPNEWERLNSIDDFLSSKRHYVRGYPAQLYIYMYRFGKDRGMFILTNKLTGQIKPIDILFDYDFAESILSKAERVYKSVADKAIPDPICDMSVCDDCALRHVCGANIDRGHAVIDTGELEDLLLRRETLLPYSKELKDVEASIKASIGDADKVFTPSYMVSMATVTRTAYEVPECSYRKQTIRRIL